MDSRKFEIRVDDQFIQVDADDVVVVEGFVMFVLLTDDGNVEKTIAMFNVNKVTSVVEVLEND